MNNRFTKRLIGCAVLHLFLGGIGHTMAASPPASSRLLGVTFFGNQLIEIDPATGSSHVVANLDTSIAAFGLAARYGKLYSFNAAMDKIVEIDPTTGHVQFIDVGMPDVEGEGDIAFRSDGTLFLSVAFDTGGVPSNKVFAIDVANRTSRLVGNCHFPYDGLAFDSHDDLYAVAQGQGKLYRIDQSNGTGAEIGSLGIAMNSPFAGLSFGTNGVLFGAIDDHLFQINTNTGAATPVSTTVLDLGFSSVSGLTLETTSSPSEQLVGLSFFSGQLVRIDETTGAGIWIGTNQSKISGVGLAASGGRLYTVDVGASRIYEIDPSSGLLVKTNSIVISGVQGEGDIAIHPTTGMGYLATALDADAVPAPRLYTFDLNTGISVLLGSTGMPLDGLAFDDTGVLYALAQAGTTLYRVNPLTAALTPVGNLGVTNNTPIGALAFTPSYGLVASLNDRLYHVNETTGAATLIDVNVLDIGFSSISGLAIVPLRKLTITYENGRVVISWNAPDSFLQSSADVTGPYTNTASQANPQTITPSEPHRFYRLQSP